MLLSAFKGHFEDDLRETQTEVSTLDMNAMHFLLVNAQTQTNSFSHCSVPYLDGESLRLCSLCFFCF